MASSPVTPLTEEQYLALDRAAEERSEFHDGQMFAMAGCSLNHSLITSRLGALLDSRVPAGCSTLSADMRLKVSKAGLYTYADVSVLCGAPQFAGDRKDILLNPKLIVEVLSPSTEAYDRGKKFESYRTIESFSEYLLVHQDRRHVEHYSRQPDGSWLLRESAGITGSVNITSLGIHLPLADIYSTALDLD